MNRRKFLKVMGAGATAFAVMPLHGSVIKALTSTRRTVAPTVNSLTNALLDTVPAPGRGLGSNSNYYLSSDCNPLTGLSVTVEVTKDIKSDIGFSFQLNAYSPIDANCVWQQYVITFDTTGGKPIKISVMVDNWPSETYKQSLGLPANSDLINTHGHVMLTLPSATVPAGYKFMIALSDDNNHNINGVTFTVVDDKSKATKADIKLESLFVNHTSPAKPITKDSLAPIHAFELNIVGPTNGKASYLYEGSGKITYAATSPLTVVNKKPSCCAAQGVFTAEAANSVYGTLAAGPSQSVTQTFDAVKPTPYTPGAALAVITQFGTSQTDLFAITSTGQLGELYYPGDGRWHPLTPPKGSPSFVRPGVALAASPQFGADNQTDVFFVDQNGNLNVFWVSGTTAWNGPQQIGPDKVAKTGANLATSRHAGLETQTDVFVVDKDGQLNMFWVIGSSTTWNGPRLIGDKSFAKSGAHLAVSQRYGATSPQMDVYVVDTKGQLNVFSGDAADHWSGPEAVGPTGLAPSAAPLAASRQYGTDNQTDVFVVDNKGQLTVFAVDGPTGKWIGPKAIGPAGLAPAGAPLAMSKDYGTSNQTDVFLIDNNGQLNMFWVDGIGHWNGPKPIGPAGIAPAGGVVATTQFGTNNQTDVYFISAAGAKTPGTPTMFESNGSGDWNGPKALDTGN